MDKMRLIDFNDDISKDKLLELTANKVQELIEGYNEIMEIIKKYKGVNDMLMKMVLIWIKGDNKIKEKINK